MFHASEWDHSVAEVLDCTVWLQVIPKYHQTLHLVGVEEEEEQREGAMEGLSHREKYPKASPSSSLTANTPSGGRVQFIKARI